MKKALEGIYSKITNGEEWISDLEDGTVEITAAQRNIGIQVFFLKLLLIACGDRSMYFSKSSPSRKAYYSFKTCITQEKIFF